MATKLPEITYYSREYGSNHWSVTSDSLSKYGIAIACYSPSKNIKYYYKIMINPTDARCYRLLIILISPSDAYSDKINCFNREYNTNEIDGLYLVSSRVSNILYDYGLIGQTFVMGNNSHSFDINSNKLILGKDNEPLQLHSHIIFRGNPSHEYIPKIKLNGPNFGQAFVFQQKQNKMAWANDEQMDVAIQYFKFKILDCVDKNQQSEYVTLQMCKIENNNNNIEYYVQQIKKLHNSGANKNENCFFYYKCSLCVVFIAVTLYFVFKN